MSGTITPSPAAAYSTAAFSDAEKSDIRRFCGYPTYGAGSAGFQSWRFFQEYGLLEFRMNNLAPAECQNVRYIVTQLYNLESAIWGASTTLNVGAAGPFTRNPNEVRERKGLFNQVRRELCNVVGVPSGPNLANGNTVALVV